MSIDDTNGTTLDANPKLTQMERPVRRERPMSRAASAWDVGEAAGAVGERPRDGERAERAERAGAAGATAAAAAGAAAPRASSMVLSTSSFMRACAKERARVKS